MSSTSRQSKILRKLVVGKDRAKRRWFQDGDTPKFQTATNLSNPARQGKNAPRRVHVLNKLFMKHITDLMSTGEVSVVTLGKGLEISHVKVTSDFLFVNVYWLAKGNTSDAELEPLLQKASGMLRHELSQLRLMGEVPRINFVKDKIHSKYAEVDNLLAIADFGDDYEPSNWGLLKQDLAPDSLNKMLPEMRHNVLGLDQAEIMDKIKRTMTKNKQAWERYEKNITNGTMTERSLPQPHTIDEGAVRLRDEEFTKFLEQRQYMKKQQMRGKKHPDFKEYYITDYDADLDNDKYDDGDYVEEYEGDHEQWR